MLTNEMSRKLTSRSFANQFWGDDDKGLESLMTRMKHSKHTCEEIVNMLRERASIEEDYGRRLARLAKTFSPKDEVGTLRDSLDVVRAEIENSARSHLEISNEIRVQLEKPLMDFVNTQSTIRKNHQNNIEKLLKAKVQLSMSVAKTKERYEAKCLEVTQIAQSKQASLPQKEMDKIKQKLEKTSSLAAQCDFDYMSGVEKLAELYAKWSEDFKNCCVDCQKLEEDKIDFLRSHLWDFTNLLSTACVSDDECLEKIRLILEKCDIEKDIQAIIDKFSTGSEIPKPLPYINFYTGTSEPKTPLDVLSPQPAYSPIARDITIGNPTLVAETMFGPTLGGAGIGPSFSSDKKEIKPEESFFAYDPYQIEENLPILFSARVLYDYQSQAVEELTIAKGQIIPVFATHDDGWWEGIVVEKGRKRKGLFPSNFVETLS